MYLSDRDIVAAIESGRLIVRPRPDFEKALSPTSLDLTLDKVEEAKVWDIDRYRDRNKVAGISEKEIGLGDFDYNRFADEYLIPVPEDGSQLVFRKGREVVIKPRGFLIWQTKEWVETLRDSQLMCFVDGKSKLSRTGLLVHLTAPTIHTSWGGNITLEIANVGEFAFILKEDDRVVQITVATVSSIPEKDYSQRQSQTHGQTKVTGAKKVSNK